MSPIEILAAAKPSTTSLKTTKVVKTTIAPIITTKDDAPPTKEPTPTITTTTSRKLTLATLETSQSSLDEPSPEMTETQTPSTPIPLLSSTATWTVASSTPSTDASKVQTTSVATVMAVVSTSTSSLSISHRPSTTAGRDANSALPSDTVLKATGPNHTAGIVIGVLFGTVAMIVLGLVLYRNRRRWKREKFVHLPDSPPHPSWQSGHLRMSYFDNSTSPVIAALGRSDSHMRPKRGYETEDLYSIAGSASSTPERPSKRVSQTSPLARLNKALPFRPLTLLLARQNGRSSQFMDAETDWRQSRISTDLDYRRKSNRPLSAASTNTLLDVRPVQDLVASSVAVPGDPRYSTNMTEPSLWSIPTDLPARASHDSRQTMMTLPSIRHYGV